MALAAFVIHPQRPTPLVHVAILADWSLVAGRWSLVADRWSLIDGR
jgi:hypothetical protein